MSVAWIFISIFITSVSVFTLHKTKIFFAALQKFEARSRSELYCTHTELISAAKSYNTTLTCILPRLDHAAYATNGKNSAPAFCFFDKQLLSSEQAITCSSFENLL